MARPTRGVGSRTDRRVSITVQHHREKEQDAQPSAGIERNRRAFVGCEAERRPHRGQGRRRAVVLSGVVDTFDQIKRAVDDAWAVDGVKAVESELLVGPAGGAITDDQIAKVCATAIGAEKLVPKGR